MDEGAEEKKCGSGDEDLEGTGVDVAVDETDDLPEAPRGGRRKLGPDEPVEVEAGKGTLVLG